MSSAINYSDVVEQLTLAGLNLSEGLRIGSPKPVRCFVDGYRGKKGWYSLHEIQFDSGELVIVGSYGVWHGQEWNPQKIQLPKGTRATKEENALIRKKMEENRKRYAAQLKAEQERAAQEAVRKWRAMGQNGESGYLQRKQVGAHGVRFTPDGAFAVPMCDTTGKIHGLQFILDKDNPAHKPKIRKMESDKRFWPTGMAMQGHFHSIGVVDPKGVNLITEGYATGASMHKATGLPSVVVFNANNVLPCLQNLAKQFPGARWLICADDDYLCRCQHQDCKKQTLVASNPEKDPTTRTLIDCEHCGQPHGKQNTGVTVAMKATMAIDYAEWIWPQFTARDGRKLTDFNDLHIEEGLPAVAAQIRRAIDAKFPTAGAAGEAASARDARTGGRGKALASFISVDEGCERFSLVYGVKDTMYDHQEFTLVPKSCVLDIMPDHAWREWKSRFDRKVVRLCEVGFDPSETDPNIKCNLWGGWPTAPDTRGSCEKLLELLEFLCSGEDKPRDVYKWMLRWLAYPIQHPGAKMKTALVVHGGQGVGKNLFFESVMAIYGEYGRVVGQADLEDRFNDWAGRKLFLIANEVIARQELFHQKNKIKALITDDWIRINPKNVAAHDERNHINLVFLSNEAQPVVLEPDDRRFMAIWTPKKREPEFYREVLEEIRNGGIEALHDHLLNHVELGDFNPGTPPMQTRARTALIEISKESPDRFIDSWQRGELDSIEYQTCAISDLYRLYEKWCRHEGEKFAYSKVKFSARLRALDGIAVERKPVPAGKGKGNKVITSVIPEEDQIPADQTWLQWLPPKIRAFRDAVEEYRG